MRLLSASLAAIFLAISPAMAADVTCATPDRTTLDVSAQADAKAAPDIATITAGVMTISPTADASMKDNSKKMNEVFAALKAAGVEDKYIQTSGMTLSPQYVYEQNKSPKITGYQASNNVTVLVHDLKKIGPVLDSLVAKGVNQISGPNFTIEKPDPLIDNAREEAVQKARARAELYAKAAGMKVKKILSMSENINYGGPPMPYAAMAMRKMEMAADAGGAPTPIAAGEVSFTINVQVTFELE